MRNWGRIFAYQNSCRFILCQSTNKLRSVSFEFPKNTIESAMLVKKWRLMVNLTHMTCIHAQTFTWPIVTLLIATVHSYFTLYIFLICTAESVSMCVIGAVWLVVSREQLSESDSVKFSCSYLTCQQSEDLADRMCLCIKASRLRGNISMLAECLCVWKPYKCVITWMICSLNIMNIKHSGECED